MMRRPPRQPVDLQAQTRFVKERVERAIVELEQIVQQTDPIFSSPRDVTLGLWLAEREIVNAYIAMKARVVAMTQSGLRLAVHHDPGHSKSWVVGVETGPGKLQVLIRYETKIAADRVLKRLLPIFRKHVALLGTRGYREHHKTSSSRISAVPQPG